MGLQLRAGLVGLVASLAIVGSTTTAGDFIIGTKPYEADRIGRIELPERVSWRVMPQYNGVRPEGRFVDPRVTVVLQDPEKSFWPLVARLDLDEADDLANQLDATITAKVEAGPNAEHEARGMDVSLYTRAYAATMNEHKAFELSGEGVGLRVLFEYRGVKPDGTRFVDERIAVVLEDADRSFWATIVWMDVASARGLHKQLVMAITKREAADAE